MAEQSDEALRVGFYRTEKIRLTFYRIGFGLVVLAIWQLGADPHSLLARIFPNSFPLVDEYWVSTPAKIAKQF